MFKVRTFISNIFLVNIKLRTNTQEKKLGETNFQNKVKL